MNELAYRFNSLSRTSSYVYAEHTVTSPLPLLRQTIYTYYVAECRLDGPSFKMDPVERSRAGIRRREIHGGPWVALANPLSGSICRRRATLTSSNICIVLRCENRTKQRDKLFVCDIWQWVVIDDGTRARIIYRVECQQSATVIT